MIASREKLKGKEKVRENEREKKETGQLMQ